MSKNINKQSKQFKRRTLMGLLIVIAAVVLVNILSSFLFYRIDLTKDKRHSLSKSTIEMLKNLEDRVYFRVYLKGKDQPADYQLFAKQVEQMLQTFRSYSKNVYYEFIDPLEGKTNEELNGILGEFVKKGLEPIPISREDAGGFSTHVVIPGAIVSYRNHEYPAKVVVADPSGSDWLKYSNEELEYNLVAPVRRLLKTEKPKVAYLDGHGELDFWSTCWTAMQLQRFYNVSRITLDGKINALRNITVDDSVSANVVPGGNKYDVLIVAQPTQPFKEYDKYIIDQFIMRGGKVLWLIDNTTASLDSLQSVGEFFATPRALYINDLFFTYGVRLNTDLIQDLSCMPVPQQVSVIGDQPQYKFMAFPYCLDVVNFGNHPIVRNLKDIKSDFAGSIDLVGNNADLNKTILMTTSERTKVVPTPSIVTLRVGMVKPNLQEYSYRNVPIAVLVEGNFQSAFKGILPVEFDTIKELDFRDHSDYTRQIFVSDGDIIRNPFDSKRNQPYPAGYDIYTRQTFDNTDFIVNCVNYLCADDDLLQLRAKNFKIGSLSSEKTRNHKVLLAVLNIGIPLLLIALMGTVLIVIRKVRFSKKQNS
ncbi:MAG: gliding motility-associated ABC transporter substrate-binding protein GldG [Bacteroidales bacterium]|jgi:gliding-associated putative ABC transporter substrate-binding component GldG|nr:gliding motility-associated ABC transporter substrate-binding protein GldG [Bacteroidales bacterium]MBR4637746.1 gliding motility-associated ABC transporter substrate-binding protein GldG [Bacteroidales bacterium]MBR6175094.1 gliding motility-associated ABC transporter substrate-binding protein GldG [Bacteroidales bacterium]MBR6904264.1 gliding motility-associated ABC transporter substrate-binding protein GldG [Bacteroidales bacterium]MCR4873196.1 gliding motility-associated ABC transporter 